MSFATVFVEMRRQVGSSLAIQAAEEEISLNRLVSAKLSQQ